MRSGHDVARLTLLNLAGIAALAMGVVMVSGSEIGFSPGAALSGLVSQLPTTLPAAILVAGAAAANLLLGATLVRLVRQRPFRSLASLILAGLVGAVLLDTAAVMLFGGLGLFRWPVVAALHVAGLAALRLRGWPLLVRPARRAPRIPVLAWLLIGLAWSAPVLLQLASPLVPFIDVLPNHVAPVEHLRTFGSYETLTTAPSPIYGPSRMFLGYVAVLGTLSTLTTLPAGLTVAAFTLPMTILVALGVRRLTTAIFGGGAAYWALIAAPLSVVFLRLPDARATVLVFPILSFALAAAVEITARRPRVESEAAPGDEPQTLSPARWPRNTDVVLGGALGAAMLVHPAMGVLGAGTVFVLGLISPAAAPTVFVALVVAGALALPQAALMAGVDMPSWAGLAGFLLAVSLGVLVRPLAARVRLPPLTVYGIAALAILLLLLVYAPKAVPALAAVLSDIAQRFPVLLAAVVVGTLVLARRGRWQLPVAAGVVWVAAGATAELIPSGSPLSDSIRFEMPKTLAYWWSWMAVAVAAGLLAHAWRGRGAVGASGPILVFVFVLVSVLPLRDEPVGPNDHNEYRVAESLSVALHHAERGYWVGYPDARSIVDVQQRELLDVLRGEIDAHRLRHETNVLHIAGSFQQWASTPLGVFAGVIETDVTLDPEDSIHTIGGRLHGVPELASLLGTGAYQYVVLEPHGIDPALRQRVLDSGYESIYGNARGEIFRASPRG